MKPVAYARFGPAGLEIRRDPYPGFKPLVFAEETLDSTTQLTRAQVEKLALDMGWSPAKSRTAAALDLLGAHPEGLTGRQMMDRLLIPHTTLLRTLARPRRDGRVKCVPSKGRDARWCLTEHLQTTIEGRDKDAASRRAAEAADKQRRLDATRQTLAAIRSGGLIEAYQKKE